MKAKNLNNNYPTVSDSGEFGLIDRIQKILPYIDRKDLIVGIGDDAAVLRIDEHRALLVTCDIQVEGQHFQLKYVSPYQSGRRAMAVNLSDIAAMGGRPTFALVSLGFPRSFPLSYFDDLFKGMRDQLSEFSAYIIGGNLSNIEKGLIIDITIIGEISPNQVLTRGGAKAGDRILITGHPGASGAGFYILEKYGKDYPSQFSTFVQKHVQPIPRIRTGQRIAQSGFATAMIDVSDGIAGDLYHICKMSGVGAEIYQAKIPLPAQLKEVELISGKSAIELALYTGEDYELLFTIKKETPRLELESIMNETGVTITEIGEIISKESGYYLIDVNGNKSPLHPKGWDHFNRC